MLCTAYKKRGEEARGFTTVRGAPQNGDGRVEADFAIMRLTAQPRHKICIFFSKVAPKIVRKRGKCKYQEICLQLQESSFLPPSFGIFCRAEVKHMLDMDSDDEAALMEMCSSDSSESSDHTSDESDHAERSTSEAVFCVVSSTAEKLIALWKEKANSSSPLRKCRPFEHGLYSRLASLSVVSSTKAQARSVKVQSLTLLTLSMSCQGITKTTTRSGSAVSPKKKKS